MISNKCQSSHAALRNFRIMLVVAVGLAGFGFYLPFATRDGQWLDGSAFFFWSLVALILALLNLRRWRYGPHQTVQTNIESDSQMSRGAERKSASERP